jgi:hypothetical protein
VFRSVELVERGDNLITFNPLDGSPRFSASFGQHANNLRNFLDFGSSSLTAHEARLLAVGLRGSFSFSGGGNHFRVGDRVQWRDFSDRARRGIVVSAFGASVFILAAAGTSFDMSAISEDRVALISSALIDKKQSSSIE